MTHRLQGRQGESPSGTTSEPVLQQPQGTAGESPAPRTAWSSLLDELEANDRHLSKAEWDAQYLQQPAMPNLDELVDRVCRGVASIQEGELLRKYIAEWRKPPRPRCPWTGEGRGQCLLHDGHMSPNHTCEQDGRLLANARAERDALQAAVDLARCAAP